LNRLKHPLHQSNRHSEKHPEEHFGKNGKGWKDKHGNEQVGDFLGARTSPPLLPQGLLPHQEIKLV
jgi:hypothetical protein